MGKSLVSCFFLRHSVVPLTQDHREKWEVPLEFIARTGPQLVQPFL